MEQSENILLVPRGKSNEEPLRLEISKIMEAEARIQEIADVNIHKAPELLACLTKAYSDINKVISGIEYEYELALQSAREIKGIVILDKAPGILKEKGLSGSKNPGGSADLRQAILDSDPEYKEVQGRIIKIKTHLSLLEGKKKSIDMAYTAVKKILGDIGQYRTGAVTVENRNSIWDKK